MNDSDQVQLLRKRRIAPALALWLIAPIFGEMVSGSTPLNEYISPFSILILGMLYGSGALLIRELLIRWGKNWRSLLLLGMAYGIYEEGLMVRSFSDPGWMDLGALAVYGRAAGVNWVWTEHLTVFHAVISIAASIVFVEILYSDKRTESWIGSRGLTWNTIAFAAALPIGALLNAKHDAPDAWLGMWWLAIALLVLAAWRTSTADKEAPFASVPRPWRFWWTGFLAAFGHIFIVYYTSEESRPPFILSMLVIALFDLFILWLILRWSGNAQGWDDRHRLALINGTLSLFLILTPLTTNGQYPSMYFSNPILLVLLWWVARKVDRRVNAEHPPRAAITRPADVTFQP
ncbi:MAG TPA: hypothetical protein VK880_00430 [Anaerolineales bacterium]|nr:hypothetical protein [Anaerolineales bacterium]